MREWEWAILRGMQTFLRTPLGDVLMVWVTHLGDGGILWILMGVLLLAKRGHRRTGALVLAALTIEFLICNMSTKNMVAAPRPCDLDPSVPLLIARPTDYSFPSGPADCLFPPVSLCTFPCGHFGRNGGGDSQRLPGLVPWKNVGPKNFAGEGWKKEGGSSMIEAKHKWERGERNVFKEANVPLPHDDPLCGAVLVSADYPGGADPL